MLAVKVRVAKATPASKSGSDPSCRHHGQARLEALTLEDVRTGQREQVPATAVFVMTGAEPRTQWLRDLVKLNDHGDQGVPRAADVRAAMSSPGFEICAALPLASDEIRLLQ